MIDGVSTSTERKRLRPDERRAQILDAATRVLAREGIARFSLEGAAREAGIAPTLPRRYFESGDQLLAAVVSEITPQVVEPLLRPDPGLSLEDRYREYIHSVRELPWAHGLWQRAEAAHRTLRRPPRSCEDSSCPPATALRGKKCPPSSSWRAPDGSGFSPWP